MIKTYKRSVQCDGTYLFLYELYANLALDAFIDNGPGMRNISFKEDGSIVEPPEDKPWCNQYWEVILTVETDRENPNPRYVPCKNDEDVVGLWDTDEEQFVELKGKMNDYINTNISFHSNNTSWIDTNIHIQQERINMEPSYQLERNVNQTLWYAIMEDGYTGVEEFENDTFQIVPYCWDDSWDNEYHFWHKPSGLMIEWYKYPLRNATANMNITHEQFYAVLQDCMNSVRGGVVRVETFEKWWE